MPVSAATILDNVSSIWNISFYSSSPARHNVACHEPIKWIQGSSSLRYHEALAKQFGMKKVISIVSHIPLLGFSTAGATIRDLLQL